MYHSAKTTRNLFTGEKAANLRKNIEKFDWAKEKAAKVIAQADFYLSYGVDRIARSIANEDLKVSYAVNQMYGCPNCGMEMMRYGDLGWLIDAEKHPWKVKCPHCGNLYPSNDFEAFFHSGQDEHGEFSYDRADRSLLVNTLYPDEAPDYAVDDGTGWHRDPNDLQDSTFAFIPYYISYALWGPMELFQASPADQQDPRTNIVVGAMNRMSEAYLITGERKYAEAGVVLLNKMASLYLRMDTCMSPHHLGYRICNGHPTIGKGRFLGCIWDVIIMNQIVGYYDILFDAIDDDMAAFLRENPIRYFGEAPQTGADIIRNIEENMLLQLYPDMISYTLSCNPGPPHEMIVKTALVLGRPDLFDQYAAFAFTRVDTTDRPWYVDDLESILMNRISRDGFAGEIAPNYNAMWSSGFIAAAEMLKGHKYDLYKNVKFVKLGEMARNYVVSDTFTLNFGDAVRTGNPTILIDLDVQVKYFLVTGNEKDAALIVKAAGDGPICTDWYLDCETVDRKIREAAAKADSYRSESRCLPGYGMAVNQSYPAGKEPESTTMWFGQNFGHCHKDSLALHIHGFGLDLMPDFGYPDDTDLSYDRFRWVAGPVSHNTAMIPQEQPITDEERAKLGGDWGYYNLNSIHGGQIHHYLAGDKVSLIDVEAPKIYNVPFRRTVVTVDLDGTSRYIVDLFEVGGKGGQRLSYHVAGMEKSVSGAVFTKQNGGTYAGADVPYRDEAYSRDWCDGFNYLKDVERSAPDVQNFSVDYTCFDNWHVWESPRDVHMKFHVLSEVAEAALCTGIPPQARDGNPKEVGFLVLKNGEGAVLFANVLEPYENASFIEQCSYETSGDTVTITVTHKCGRVDTITVIRDGADCRLTVESTMGYAMSYGDTVLTGAVVDFTRELAFENFVTVRLDGDVNAELLAGRFIDIETDVEPNGFYEIKGAESLGGGLWKLDVGDCTFVAKYIDRTAKEKGYLYFAEAGANVRITM